MLKTIEDYKKLDSYFSENSYLYDGVDVGYLIRNQAVAKIRAKNNIGNNLIVLNRKTYFRLISAVFRTFFNLFKKRNVWVFSNSERRKNYSGYYVDRVASIVSEAHKSVLYVENPILVPHKFPTKDLILSDALFFLISYIISIFSYKKDKLKISEQSINLNLKYNIKLEPNKIIKRFWGQYKFMTLFLKYVYKPKKVYVVYPNGYYGYIKAFKDNKIPVIELQHGVIYPTHPSYNFANSLMTKNFHPNYVFVYGHKDKECLKKLKYVKDDKIHVVGSYGLWYCKHKTLTKNSYLRSISDVGFKRIVLFTATNDDLDYLYEVGMKLSSHFPHFGVLLLPRVLNNNLKSKDNLLVLDNKKVNIFQLYHIIDYHITQNSTAALEALYIGKPSFILETNRSSIFSRNYKFITSLNYVKTIDELCSLINNENYLPPDKSDINQIFEENVIDLFLKADGNVKAL